MIELNNTQCNIGQAFKLTPERESEIDRITLHTMTADVDTITGVIQAVCEALGTYKENELAYVAFMVGTTAGAKFMHDRLEHELPDGLEAQLQRMKRHKLTA